MVTGDHKEDFGWEGLQQPAEEQVETMPGVQCWRRAVPVQRVGLYSPGGTAPLFWPGAL